MHALVGDLGDMRRSPNGSEAEEWVPARETAAIWTIGKTQSWAMEIRGEAELSYGDSQWEQD